MLKNKCLQIAKVLIFLLLISVFLGACSKKRTEDTLDKLSENAEDKVKVEVTTQYEVKNEPEALFEFSSKYRYKNSYENITIYFTKIELVSEYKDVLPEREAFLIFHLSCDLTPSSKTTLINLPSVIDGTNISYTKLVGTNKLQEWKYYESLNSGFGPSIEMKDGLRYDLCTLINQEHGCLGYSEPNRNGYVSAHNVNYVSTTDESGDWSRIIVFDIYKTDALNPENYLVFDPHGKPGEELEHPKEKIHFSKYIKDNMD